MGGISYGIPALAKQIAFRLSPSTEATLGQEALAGLDKVLLEPTRLAPERQAEVKALFSDMTTNIDGAGDYRLGVPREQEDRGQRACAALGHRRGYRSAGGAREERRRT